jgi:regulator of sirC expression with transglutaminase-like and TPR domain
LKAFILLTRFRYPELDEEMYIAKVEKLRKNVWLEINPDLTALEKVKVLNHIFFDIYGFRGQLPQQISIGAYFLNDIFDNRKGSAIALGILYLYIAQKLDIPLFGIDLHHHFALVYMEDNIKVKDPGKYTLEEILFYIAVVNKGSVFTKNEIRRYLRQINLEEDPRYFLPNSNVQVIRKLINEMINTFEVTGKQDKADLLLKMIKALD